MAEVDWIIHGVKELYDKNPFIKGMVNFHTHGLEKHHCKNLSIITLIEVYSPEEVCYMINTVGRLMVDGDKFQLNKYHNIWDEDGNLEFKFYLIEAKCFGEKVLRMILPDKDGKFPTKELFDSDDSMTHMALEMQTSKLFEMYEK